MQESPASPIYDLSESPDALLVHLIGGELVLAFDDEVKMLNTIKTLGSPVSASHKVSKDGKSRMPFAVYVAPKANSLLSAATFPMLTIPNDLQLRARELIDTRA